MDKRQAARLTALQRIQVWLDGNATALGTVSKSTSRTDLDTAVQQLQQYDIQQTRAETEATSCTKVKAQARQDLRLDHMQPIAAIAKKKLDKTPGIQDLAYPHENTSDPELVARGAAMADMAEQYKQVFVDQQMPDDFVAQLRAAVQAVRQAITDQSDAKLRVNKATKSLKDQLTVTKTDVKVLNGLVVKQLKGNQGLLGAWANAKRVYAKPVATTAPAPTPTPASVVAPVPTPAAATPTAPVAPAPAPASPATPTGPEVPVAKA